MQTIAFGRRKVSVHAQRDKAFTSDAGAGGGCRQTLLFTSAAGTEFSLSIRSCRRAGLCGERGSAGPRIAFCIRLECRVAVIVGRGAGAVTRGYASAESIPTPALEIASEPHTAERLFERRGDLRGGRASVLASLAGRPCGPLAGGQEYLPF